MKWALAFYPGLIIIAVVAVLRWRAWTKEAKFWMAAYFDKEKECQQLADFYLEKAGSMPVFANGSLVRNAVQLV